MEANEDLTYREMYKDLCEARQEALPAHYFTRRKYEADSGSTKYAVMRILNAKVQEGTLQTRKALIDGHLQHIYWFTV